MEDTLERLYADFGHGDVFMALSAMNFTSWAQASRSDRITLYRKARILCSTLGVQFEEGVWVSAMAWMYRRHRELGSDVDRRSLWLDALNEAERSLYPAASQGDVLKLKPIVIFSVSLMGGTGSLERLLGAHVSFLRHHVTSGSPEDDMVEACLEIATEGPKTEDEV